MFLEKTEIFHQSPCLGDEGRLKIIARLSSDVEALLPYLNAVIKNCLYLSDIKKITFNKGLKIFSIHPKTIGITKLENITDAFNELEWIKNTINHTFDNKNNITPLESIRLRPYALQIWNLLPKQIGCDKCGHNTCTAFACKLMLGEAHPSRCPLLYNGEYEDCKAKLIKMLDVPEFLE